jgi:hypothetical protein
MKFKQPSSTLIKLMLSQVMVFIFCFAQAQKLDTIQVFDYQDAYDKWSLKIYKSDTFEMLIQHKREAGLYGFVGHYKLSDSSIHFFYSAESDSLRNIFLNDSIYDKTVHLLLSGKPVKCIDGLIYPIPYTTIISKIKSYQKQLSGTYKRSNEFQQWTLKFKALHRLNFHYSECLGGTSELYRWVQIGNHIKLLKKTQKNYQIDHTVLNDFVDWNEFYLIGKAPLHENYQLQEGFVEELFWYFKRIDE